MAKLAVCLLVYLMVFWACFACRFARASFLSATECGKVKSVEVRYNEFFELYLGHDQGSDDIQEHGVVYKSLIYAVKTCCADTPLKFTRTRELIEELVQDDVLVSHPHDRNNTDLVFYFPEFTTQSSSQPTVHDLPFLKLRKSPGFALVMLKSESHLNVSAADIIYPSWPIFALILALSWAVGIVAWVFDNFTNSEEFPRPFVRGMFSGFWWAIVTMSTVGYGDKTPKSYPARLLAVFWILAGAVLLSLFTANTTSIITTSRIEKNERTVGKTVGIVNMHDFVEAELNLGAHLVDFYHVQDALESLRNKSIDRLIFPHYLDLLYLMSDKDLAQDVSLDDLYIAKVFDKSFQIGMVLSHSKATEIRNDRFYKCIEIMTSRFTRKYDYDYSIIDEGIASSSSDTFDLATTKQFLYGILGIIGVMVIIGVIFDLVVRYRKKSKNECDTVRSNPV